MELSYFANVINVKYSRKCTKCIEYGTAGFRTKSDILGHVLYRMGLLAVLRSKVKKGAAIGLMITASHNLEPDNGIKLIDPAGEMLETSWETIATDLANVQDGDLISMLASISTKENIDLSVPATVITGRDTRESGPVLLDAAIEGIRALTPTVVIIMGIVTTPQLHYIVVCRNTDGAYGDPTLQGYYSKIATAFKSLRGAEEKKKNYTNVLHLDVANGVGGIAAKEFQKRLKDALDIILYNDGDGRLNFMCGADYVKINQSLPLGIPSKNYKRCVSIDGDADRVVYYYVDEKTFYLLDGDRIATLVAAYFKELLDTSGLVLQLGIVQTAYSNGSSTDYISNVLQVPVACVPTGVKHLHKRALEFDIGIYFEANGHGTIIFKDTAKETIKNHAKNKELSEAQRVASTKLRDVIDLINETVGDALSDMLLVETILRAKDWDVIDWRKSYEDLPNKQIIVRVKDRNVITTTNAERQCLTPVGLQEEIDKIVSEYPKGRCFVRPSGTEDIVRVYAECEGKPAHANSLATAVAMLVSNFVNDEQNPISPIKVENEEAS